MAACRNWYPEPCLEPETRLEIANGTCGHSLAGEAVGGRVRNDTSSGYAYVVSTTTACCIVTVDDALDVLEEHAEDLNCWWRQR